jgi:hypothetical protein
MNVFTFINCNVDKVVLSRGNERVYFLKGKSQVQCVYMYICYCLCYRRKIVWKVFFLLMNPTGCGDIQPLLALLTNLVLSERSSLALQHLLEQQARDLSTGDLRAIIALQDVEYAVLRDAGGWDERQVTNSLDCTLLRQLAQQELHRRELEVQ